MVVNVYDTINVLILVVMVLGKFKEHNYIFRVLCLNPCCNGIGEI